MLNICEKRIYRICIDSGIKEFADKDFDEFFQYIYDEIYNSFIEVK